MTSQVAILNYSGVAIASDTIKTLEVGSSVKTLPNSHKVFELGNNHKILVLNSNLATICGVPAGPLIASWAKELGSPLPKLTDYHASFIEFLKSMDDIKFPAMKQELRTFVEQRLRYIVDQIAAKFEGQKPWWDSVRQASTTDSDFIARYRRRVSRVVSSYTKWIENLEDPGYDFELSDLQIGFEKADIRQLVDAWLPDFSCPEATKKRVLKTMALAYKKLDLHGTTTELGFVGYGANDFYPQVANIEIQQVAYGTARWNLNAIQDPSGQGTAVLWWWAQTDAVESFLKGFHPSFLEDLREKVKLAIIDDREEDFDDPSEFTDEDKTIWGSIGESVFSKLERYIEQYEEKHYDNFLKTLAHMDASELAKVAATFLDMQILSTHNTMELPTVGGLVEVATVNLANGVVWRSRLPD